MSTMQYGNVLDGAVATNSDDFKANDTRMNELLKDLREVTAKVQQGTGSVG